MKDYKPKERGFWVVEGEGQPIVKILDVGHNKTVATLTGWAEPYNTQHAQLIVTAVNNHEALLETLRELVAQADDDTPEEARTEHFREALKEAVNLILTIEGRESEIVEEEEE
jgi:hypothetical protein